MEKSLVLHLKKIESNGALLVLIARDEAGKRYTVQVSGFRPYFYVPQTEVATIKKRGLEHEPGLPALDGTPTFKVYVDSPGSVAKRRKGFERTFEADVPYTRRFLVDTGIHDGFRVTGQVLELADNMLIVRPENLEPVSFRTPDRQVLYDIETKKPDGSKHYSPPVEAAGSITALTLHDSFDEGTYVTYIWHPEHGSPGQPKVQQSSHWSDAFGRHVPWTIRMYGSEDEMLVGILQFLKRTQPDVLQAWNGHHGHHRKNQGGFDAPYIINRLRRIGISPNQLSPLGSASAGYRVFGKEAASAGGGKWHCNIDGIQLIDAMSTFQIKEGGFTAQVPFSDLKRVTEKFTGKKLKKDPNRDFNEWWLNGTEEFLDYSFDDVDALVFLEKNEGYLAFARDMQQFVGAEDANKLFTPMSLIDSVVLRIAKKKGICVPTSDSEDSDDYEAEGGFVLPPKVKGLQRRVGFLDLTTMYVHVIISGNISPETHVPHPTEKEMEDLICLPSDMGPQFFRKPSDQVGLLPEVCQFFRAVRKKYDDLIDAASSAEEVKKLKHQRQPAKQLLLGVWGTSLSPFFRLFKPEVGSSITGTGRYIHENVQDFVAAQKDHVVYGDSISGERCVTVMDPQDRVQVIPVQELFSMGPSRTTADGKERVRMPGWKALAVHPETLQSAWSPLEEVIRHAAPDKPIVRRADKWGETVCTADHSFMALQGDRLIESSPATDQDSPFYRVPSIPAVTTLTHVDVWEYLKDVQYTKNGRTVRTHLTPDGNRVWFGESLRKNRQSVPRIINVGTPEWYAFISLLAAYIPEGSSSTPDTTDTRWMSAIVSSDQSWLEYLRGCYCLLFGVERIPDIFPTDPNDIRVLQDRKNGRVYEYKDDTHRLAMSTQLAAVFFKTFAGQRSDGKRIPDFMFHASRADQDYFLSVMVEGDGNRRENDVRYSDAYKAAHFVYTSKSLQLISGISFLLNQAGRHHTIKAYKRKQTWDIVTSGRPNTRHTVRQEPWQSTPFVYDLAVKETHTFVDACGHIVLHNTDSFAVPLPEQDPIEHGEALAEMINAYFADLSSTMGMDEHGFEIGLETMYDPFLMGDQKKIYAGYIVWAEGKWQVDENGNPKPVFSATGIQGIKSDAAPITKETSEAVLKALLNGSSPAEIMEYVRTVHDGVMTGDVPLEDVIKAVTLNLDPDNPKNSSNYVVKGVKNGRVLYDFEYPIGGKVRMVRLRGGDEDWMAIPDGEDLPKDLAVDMERHAELTVLRPLQNILSWVDMTTDSVRYGTEMTAQRRL